MALTRANVEAILIRRVGKLLTAADLNGTTMDGMNADLNDPIGYAVRRLGGTVASVVQVVDADLAGIASDDYDQLFDLAELRTLETIAGNLDDVDITLGPRSESLSQLASQVDKRIEKLAEKVQRTYGVDVGTLSAGVIGLDFAEHEENEDV